VGVRSIVGKGTTFHAILPRAAAPGSEPVPTRGPPPSSAPPNAPTVLVIEDDLRDREDLVAALGAAGFATEVTSSGAQAVARCRERRFDAITLDLLLPDMTGLEALRQIRDEGTNRSVPVVVITVVAERGAVAGFAVHDVLAKPLDAGQLVAALARAGVHGRTGLVLVIDDDEQARKLMEATLNQLGYRTRSEADADRALRGLAAAPPAAIVLDLLMPGMSGFEFLTRLRFDPLLRRIPVIVWTSKELTLNELAALRSTANAVVAKGPSAKAAVLSELAACLPLHLGRSADVA
jgi:CheY-like chemotaxis protein